MTVIPRANNLTALRIASALAVLVGHFLYLGIPQDLRDASRIYPFADIGVQIFFVISGLLVTQSYLASSGPLTYGVRRLFRIYPLYLVVILLQAAIMVLLIASSDQLQFGELLRYLGFNLAFLNFYAPDLGGLFAGLPEQAVNPSLWTLKIEVMFYALVPLLVVIARRAGPAVLVLIFAASVAFVWAFSEAHPALARQLPGQLRFFVVGAALSLHWERIAGYAPTRKHLAGVVALAALLLAALINKSGLSFEAVAQPLLISLFVVAAGFWLPTLPTLRDTSYGIYLLHGPIIQVALLAGLHEATLSRLIAFAIAVYALAWLASRYIEVPSIALGRRVAKRLDRSRLSNNRRGRTLRPTPNESLMI